MDLHVGSSRLPFSLYPIQRQCLDLVENDLAVWDGFGGSRGGCKSDTLRKIMLKRRVDYPGTAGLLLRRTWSDVYDNHVVEYFRTWPELKQFYQNKRLTLPNGSVIRFGYADNEGDVQHAFQGQSFMDVMPDEATHFYPSDLTCLKSICRWPGVRDGQCKMVLTFNPAAEGHANVSFSFLKRLMHDQDYLENENPADYMFLQSYAWDNVQWSLGNLERDGLNIEDYYAWSDDQRFQYFLLTDYGRKLNSMPEAFRAGHLMGSWEQFGGQYFDLFDRRKHVAPVPQMERWYSRWLSVDYGFGHPSAVYWHVALRDGRYCTYRELVENALTPKELAAKVAELNCGEALEAIYVDPTTDAKRESRDTVFKQLSQAFESHGLPNCSRADNDRVGGWMLMYQLLKSGTWFIDPSCRGLIQKMPMALRDPKHLEDVLKFDGDDELDSVRYGFKSRLDPADVPREVSTAERMAELEKERDQYGRPLSKTSIMMRLALQKKTDTSGYPWRIGDKR
jgi:phage terminase large subunit